MSYHVSGVLTKAAHAKVIGNEDPKERGERGKKGIAKGVRETDFDCQTAFDAQKIPGRDGRERESGSNEMGVRLSAERKGPFLTGVGKKGAKKLSQSWRVG